MNTKMLDCLVKFGTVLLGVGRCVLKLIVLRWYCKLWWKAVRNTVIMFMKMNCIQSDELMIRWHLVTFIWWDFREEALEVGAAWQNCWLRCWSEMLRKGVKW